MPLPDARLLIYEPEHFEILYGPSAPKQRLLTEKGVGSSKKISFTKDVKPILDSRCVVCHSCYDAANTTGHQLASRSYMDILRQGAQDSFLRFMPAMSRQSIYNSWTLGFTSFRAAPAYFNIHHETQVKFRTMRYQEEFFDQVRLRLGNAAGNRRLHQRLPHRFLQQARAVYQTRHEAINRTERT